MVRIHVPPPGSLQTFGPREHHADRQMDARGRGNSLAEGRMAIVVLEALIVARLASGS